MKTIEEFLKYINDNENKTAIHYDLLDIEDYVQQQVSIAVEKVLIKCSAKAILHSSQLAEEILQLAPQILEELKGGEGDGKA